MAVSKNITIEANGLQGDDLGRVLGSNTTTQGVYTPVVGTCVRDSVATYIDRNGVLQTAPSNQLRVDWTNGVAEILLEPASSNKIQYSEDFTQWSESSVNDISISQVNNYLGKTFSKISVIGNSQAQKYISITPNVVSSNEYTFSIFIQKGNQDYIALTTLNDLETSYFDLVNGEVVSTSGIRAEIKDFGNGVFRISHTTEATSSSKLCGVWFSTENSISTGDITGAYVEIFGAQLEPLSYPTSYIKNDGNSAGVTRQADSLTNFGSEQIIDSESGVLFFEGNTLAAEGNVNKWLGIGSGSDDNYVYIKYPNYGSDFFTVDVDSNGVRYDTPIINVEETINHKIFIKYNSTTLIVYLNGIEVANVVSESPINLKKIDCAYFNNTLNFYGRIRKLMHLPYNTNIAEL